MQNCMLFRLVGFIECFEHGKFDFSSIAYFFRFCQMQYPHLVKCSDMYSVLYGNMLIAVRGLLLPMSPPSSPWWVGHEPRWWCSATPHTVTLRYPCTKTVSHELDCTCLDTVPQFYTPNNKGCNPNWVWCDIFVDNVTATAGRDGGGRGWIRAEGRGTSASCSGCTAHGAARYTTETHARRCPSTLRSKDRSQIHCSHVHWPSAVVSIRRAESSWKLKHRVFL